ncbi:hypothetical protein ACJX0J_011742 [Zea mays]
MCCLIFEILYLLSTFSIETSLICSDMPTFFSSGAMPLINTKNNKQRAVSILIHFFLKIKALGLDVMLIVEQKVSFRIFLMQSTLVTALIDGPRIITTFKRNISCLYISLSPLVLKAYSLLCHLVTIAIIFRGNKTMMS